MAMKRGSYLENYLESVSALPGELKRNFQLMRELDTRTQENLEEVEQLQRHYAALARKNGKAQDDEEADSLVERIRQQFQECIDVADEKDADLKKFEAELDQISATAPPTVPITPEPPRKVGRGTPNGGLKKDEKRKLEGAAALTTPLKRVPDARVLQVDLDMPIDPNEPTYCVCHRVSFGEMVGCDNPECPTEWFHFDCVGLTGPPKGKWFCADCSQTMKNRITKK